MAAQTLLVPRSAVVRRGVVAVHVVLAGRRTVLGVRGPADTSTAVLRSLRLVAA